MAKQPIPPPTALERVRPLDHRMHVSHPHLRPLHQRDSPEARLPLKTLAAF